MLHMVFKREKVHRYVSGTMTKCMKVIHCKTTVSIIMKYDASLVLHLPRKTYIIVLNIYLHFNMYSTCCKMFLPHKCVPLNVYLKSCVHCQSLEKKFIHFKLKQLSNISICAFKLY